MHELIRAQAMRAWESIKNGEPNPLASNLAGDAEVIKFLSMEQVGELMDYRAHLGDAPKRSRELVWAIKHEIGLI
jgi:adenylosuccinate lyase